MLVKWLTWLADTPVKKKEKKNIRKKPNQEFFVMFYFEVKKKKNRLKELRQNVLRKSNFFGKIRLCTDDTSHDNDKHI